MSLMSDAADIQELTGCSHDLCRCTLMGPVVGETFCSDTCRLAVEDGIESEACPCGHPACDTPP